MDFIRACISNPVKVTVAVILTLLFGLIALFTIPVQLTPNVDQPVITIETSWVGRSPEEVEREVIEKQEEKIKGVAGLRKMSASASQGRASIKLEFFIGTNMNRALQEVSDKLREVPSYPDEVDQPVITASSTAEENAIAWMILQSDEPGFDVQSLFLEVDKRVKPYLERVEGLSQVNIYGGREHQVHIQLDPRRLAERGITFNQLVAALRNENVNVSAGDLTDGRLDVRVRTVGQYDTLEAIRQTIVTYTDGGPIRVKDLGEVVLTLEKRRAFVHSLGQEGMAINAVRETGANVIQAMDGLKKRIEEVNRDVLPSLGPKLRLYQVYDETGYIYDALQLVIDNLWQGGLLATIVLMLFLRKIRPTFIISLAMPISVIGTFVALTAFGRNLNVVSLAGLAFSVGMVVDNAVVVLENTDRHLMMGKGPRQAAYDAATEVWLAIIASTGTTLIVFLPVLNLQEEAGQLFRDISLAICAAVFLSLVVSITVIPAACAAWLKPHVPRKHAWANRLDSFMGLNPLIGRMTERYADLIHWSCGHTFLRVAVVTVVTAGSLWGAYVLMPPTTYLPKGNRNLVFGIMLNPPAYNIEQNRTIADRVEANIRPYWEAQSPDQVAALSPVMDFMTGQQVQPPAIENFFFVSWNGTNFMGAASRDKNNVAPLGTLLTTAMSGIPGSFGFAQQVSLFGGGLGGTNAIDVEIVGNDLDDLRNAANALYMQFTQKYGFGGVRPDPLNFNLLGPEIQVKIDRVRAADLGIDVAALGLGVQSLVDGLKVGEYRYGGDSIDLLLVRDPAMPFSPDALRAVPVAVTDRAGGRSSIPLSAVANIRHTTAPQQINRVEQRRAITLSVVPPPNQPLEAATNDIAAMLAPMRASGQIAQGVDVNFAGTADKLVQVRESMLGKWHGWSFKSLESLVTSRLFLALLINYLLMCALFESFLHPLVIMFTVPLATIGGFMGLALVHRYDPSQLLDVVTMLGFIILIGTIVNNAILLVAQALNYMKGFGESEQDRLAKAMTPREAIRESVRTRLRPVMMTTLTTTFGLLPLVIAPGAGSELYRGLGSVVLGGLLVGTLFTLAVVPLLFSLTLDMKIAIYRALSWPVPELNEGEALAPASGTPAAPSVARASLQSPSPGSGDKP